MTLLEAIQKRHTIRTYTGAALEGTILEELNAKIAEINADGKLHFQLINGKENAFDDFTIRYGKWTNVTNYIALVGKDTEELDELCGYYGEQIVLWAETQGLKTGWVETGYTEKPEVLDVKADERLVLSIAIGESELTGKAHRVKSAEALSEVEGEMPVWFRQGMAAATLAPSAGNQQLFKIHYDGEQVSITTEPGFLEKVDLGVAKYHFELGSHKDHSIWN